ncbi:MAG: hypothetical protein NXI01_08095 [Gammaproteobacteria bacterium]|nr:hypothetical protein [Gammaproteobacteria bacterium]
MFKYKKVVFIDMLSLIFIAIGFSVTPQFAVNFGMSSMKLFLPLGEFFLRAFQISHTEQASFGETIVIISIIVFYFNRPVYSQ